jgi:hypothetical protein
MSDPRIVGLRGKQPMSRSIKILFLYVLAAVLIAGCTVASKYPTKSYQNDDERKAINQIYSPSESQIPKKEMAPFMKDEHGPALNVNGLEISADDIRSLYEYFGTYRNDDPVVLKREALMQWISAYAVMSQWPDKIEPARKRISELHDQVVNGANFKNLVVENSQEPGADKSAGDLGTMGRGQLVPVFEMHAMTLPLNQISEPFPTIFGWHIIEVLERNTTDPDNPTFHAEHLLLMHGLDPANGDAIRQNSARWTSLAKVEILLPELEPLLPQYVNKPAESNQTSTPQPDIKKPGK